MGEYEAGEGEEQVDTVSVNPQHVAEAGGAENSDRIEGPCRWYRTTQAVAMKRMPVSWWMKTLAATRWHLVGVTGRK